MIKRGSGPQNVVTAMPINQYSLDKFKDLVERTLREVMEEVEEES